MTITKPNGMVNLSMGRRRDHGVHVPLDGVVDAVNHLKHQHLLRKRNIWIISTTVSCTIPNIIASIKITMLFGHLPQLHARRGTPEQRRESSFSSPLSCREGAGRCTQRTHLQNDVQLLHNEKRHPHAGTPIGRPRTDYSERVMSLPEHLHESTTVRRWIGTNTGGVPTRDWKEAAHCPVGAVQREAGGALHHGSGLCTSQRSLSASPAQPSLRW